MTLSKSFEKKVEESISTDSSLEQPIERKVLEVMERVQKRGNLSEKELEFYLMEDIIPKLDTNNDGLNSLDEAAVLLGKLDQMGNKIVAKVQESFKEELHDPNRVTEHILYRGLGIDKDINNNGKVRNITKGVIDELMALPDLLRIIVKEPNKFFKGFRDLLSKSEGRSKMLKSITESFTDVAGGLESPIDQYKTGRSAMLIVLVLIPGGVGKALVNGVKRSGKRAQKAVIKRNATVATKSSASKAAQRAAKKEGKNIVSRKVAGVKASRKAGKDMNQVTDRISRGNKILKHKRMKVKTELAPIDKSIASVKRSIAMLNKNPAKNAMKIATQQKKLAKLTKQGKQLNKKLKAFDKKIDTRTSLLDDMAKKAAKPKLTARMKTSLKTSIATLRGIKLKALPASLKSKLTPGLWKRIQAIRSQAKYIREGTIKTITTNIKTLQSGGTIVTSKGIKYVGQKGLTKYESLTKGILASATKKVSYYNVWIKGVGKEVAKSGGKATVIVSLINKMEADYAEYLVRDMVEEPTLPEDEIIDAILTTELPRGAIQFDKGGIVITPSMKSQIDDVMSKRGVTKSTGADYQDQIKITGRSSTDGGTKDFNLALSNKRAKVIKDYVMNKYGLDPNLITLDGKWQGDMPDDASDSSKWGEYQSVHIEMDYEGEANNPYYDELYADIYEEYTQIEDIEKFDIQFLSEDIVDGFGWNFIALDKSQISPIVLATIQSQLHRYNNLDKVGLEIVLCDKIIAKDNKERPGCIGGNKIRLSASSADRNLPHFARTIHHEIMTGILFQNGVTQKAEREIAALNDSSFAYTPADQFNTSHGYGDKSLLKEGFISSYSKTTASNDLSVIAEVFITNKEVDGVNIRQLDSQEYPILYEKVELVKGYLKEHINVSNMKIQQFA